MSEGDDHVRVTGRLQAIRNDAVMFSVGDAVPRAAWIPRSLIHGADDIALKGKNKGDQMALRIFRWKAEEAGFVTDRDDRTLDLF
jgi:hypothetical protein